MKSACGAVPKPQIDNSQVSHISPTSWKIRPWKLPSSRRLNLVVGLCLKIVSFKIIKGFQSLLK